MTLTVDDTVYETLRPFVEEQTIGALLSDFARSRSAKPAALEEERDADYRAMIAEAERQSQKWLSGDYTEAELEAGYRAMAADEEREAEAQEWCNALIGDIDNDDDEAR